MVKKLNGQRSESASRNEFGILYKERNIVEDLLLGLQLIIIDTLMTVVHTCMGYTVT